jgi:hypothetical protein
MNFFSFSDRLFSACTASIPFKLNSALPRMSFAIAICTAMAVPVLAQTEFGSVSLGDGTISNVVVTFPATGTAGDIDVLSGGQANLDFIDTGGGTCVAGNAYAANDTCTVQVKFAPKYAGLRYGMVSIGFFSTASVNAPFLITYLHGVGVGPQLVYQNNTISTSATNPVAAAVDPIGDVFIAEANYNTGSPGPGGIVDGFFESFYVGSEAGPPNGLVGIASSRPDSITVDGGGILIPGDGQHSVYWSIPTGRGYNQAFGFLLPPGGTPPGESGPPWFDGIGNTYFIQEGQLYTQKIQADGTVSNTASPLMGYVQPQILAVGLSGIALVADIAGTGGGAVFTDQGKATRPIAIVNNSAAKSSALSFQSTLVGSSSGSQTETVTNSGTTTLEFSEIEFPEDFVQDFSDGNQCVLGMTLLIGRTCNISVFFKPQTGGQLSEAITVTIDINNQPGKQQAIPVSGIASVPAPIFSLKGGTYTAPQSLMLSDLALHAAIFYTTDGSIPTTASTPYNGPLLISKSEMVSALAVSNGASSRVASATYVFPSSQVQVTLSSATLTYPASTIATIQILPGSTPTHAPSGTVQLVLENGLTSPILTLSGSGHGSAAAYYTLSGVGAGQHTAYAIYSGDALNPSGTSSKVPLSVNPAPVKLSISCQNPVLVHGADYRCAIYTTPIQAGSNASVSCKSDLGTFNVPLNGGTATCIYHDPPLGQHSVVISYIGSANYQTPAGQTETFTVVAPK